MSIDFYHKLNFCIYFPSTLNLVHESVLTFFKPTNFTSIVTNASNLENLSLREINWLQDKWIPQAIDKGFGACAVIEPTKCNKH